MKKNIFVFLVFCFYSLIGSLCFSAEVSEEHTFSPIEWSFQGNPVPETHWSPWLPPAQIGVRFKLGFKFSSGTMTIKNPVKLTFLYDPNQCRSGGDFRFKVKAEPQASSDYNTFETAFGICLPNKIQLGTVGLTGVPIDLPWFDIDMDFWDLVSELPKVGETIASAASNIGVYTSSEDPLPLGATAEYHDERELINVEIPVGSISELAEDIFEEIPESARENAVRLLKVANACTDSEALEALQELIEQALSILYDSPSIALNADPHYILEGVRLRVTLRCFIPGGKGSGVWTLYFTSPGQEQEVTFRDITPFIETGDQLNIVVDEIAYEFRLKQCLSASINLAVIPVPLDRVEKVVTYTVATKDTSNEFNLEIPIETSTALVQGLCVNPGCVSASVNFASPNVALKGTVKAYEGDRLVKTVTETSFKNAHNIIVADLNPATNYRFVLDCVNVSGDVIPGGEVSTTTLEKCPERTENTTCNKLTLSNPSATAGEDYIDFSWETNQNASTEVMFSPSPDLSVNYVVAVKKRDGTVVQGWVTRGARREFVKDHSIRVTGLEPGTLYYYNLYSWTFEDKDETKDPLDKVGYVGSISTLARPPLPTQRIKVQDSTGTALSGITVVFTKQGDPNFRLPVVTGNDGFTPLVTLSPGEVYIAGVYGNSCFQDNIVSLSLSNEATGQLPDKILILNRRVSSGGYVYDTQGRPLAGVTIQATKAGVTRTANTDNRGFYTFDGGWLGEGTHILQASKEGYKTQEITAEVNSCGLFSALPCTLQNRDIGFNILVKNHSGSPIGGAKVIIKEGDNQLASLSTNSQGQVSYTQTGYNDDSEHTFTIEVNPSLFAGNALPITETITAITGSVNNLEIVCPQDLQAPIISDVSITREGNNFNFSFKSSEPSMYSIEHVKPDGTSTSRPFAYMLGDNQDSITDLKIDMTRQPSGVHKFKIKVKDLEGGNIAETPYYEKQWGTLNVASGPSITLQLGTTTDSITFNWQAWYKEEEFGKYVIELEPPFGQTIEITDYSTISYTLKNLNSSALYCGTFKVYSNTGELLYTIENPARFCVSTQGLPPEIKNIRLTPNPAGTNQNITLSADISDPDTDINAVKITLNKIASVTNADGKTSSQVTSSQVIYERDYNNTRNVSVNCDFTVAQEGTYQLNIKAIGLPPEGEVNLDLTVLAQLDPSKPKISLTLPAEIPISTAQKGSWAGQLEILFVVKESSNLVATIDWGFGKSDTLGIDPQSLTPHTIGTPGKPGYQEFMKGNVPITPIYNKEGIYEVSAFLEVILPDGRKITSDVVKANVNVISDPPVAILNKRDVYANAKVFTIQASPGSYPVDTWTIDFGDGNTEAGKGEVSKEIRHYYMQKMDNCKVEFTVKDTQGKQVTKNLLFSIPQDGTEKEYKGFIEGATVTDVEKMIKSSQKGKLLPAEVLSRESDKGIGLEQRREETKRERVDLSVEKLEFTREPFVGEKTEITVSLKNNSPLEIRDCSVILESTDGFHETKNISLKSRMSEKIQFEWAPKRQGIQRVTAWVKYEPDSNPKNNTLSEKVEVKSRKKEETKKEEAIDLSVDRFKLPPVIYLGERVEVYVIVKNNSEQEVKECFLVFSTEDGFQDKQRLSLSPKRRENIRFEWIPKREGMQKITASLEYKPDVAPRNNTLSEKVEVKSKKEEELKISIRRLTIENEKSGVLPAGIPLVLNLELDASCDFEAGLDVNIRLMGKENKEEFRQTIKGLKRGRNSFRWELLRELKPDRYELLIEIVNREANIREKTGKEFEVVER